MADRSVKKGMDLVENKADKGGSRVDESRVDESDEKELSRQENKKKAGCDGDCDTCTRRHCPYGKK